MAKEIKDGRGGRTWKERKEQTRTKGVTAVFSIIIAPF